MDNHEIASEIIRLKSQKGVLEAELLEVKNRKPPLKIGYIEDLEIKLNETNSLILTLQEVCSHDITQTDKTCFWCGEPTENAD